MILGRHSLLELEDCNLSVLNDLEKIRQIMLEAAEVAKVTIIESHFHQFSPYGVSGVVVIAESHLTIHTWPEHAYAAIDLFTCGETLKSKAALSYLARAFEAKRASVAEIHRGPLGVNRMPGDPSRPTQKGNDVFREILQVVL